MAYRQRQQGSRGVQHNALAVVPAPRMSAEEASQAAITEARRRVIDQLNAACEAYERSFFAPAYLVIMLEQKLRGLPRGERCYEWVVNLRREFYHRKAIVEALTNLDDINGCVKTYNNFGPPPFTEQDLLRDARG